MPRVQKKSSVATALSRLTGIKGGRARAKKLSAKKRNEIAKKAAKARWGPSDRAVMSPPDTAWYDRPKKGRHHRRRTDVPIGKPKRGKYRR